MNVLCEKNVNRPKVGGKGTSKNSDEESEGDSDEAGSLGADISDA